jgi:GNAT superfamily N-acetyltransferase
MTGHHNFPIIQLQHPADADAGIRQKMTDCWISVSNAGGAAGFPFPPVDAGHVAPRVDHLADQLDPQRSRILLAMDSGALQGWVVLSRGASPLVAHWGTVNHLQTQTGHRNRGIGSALMQELRRIARDEMGVEQLHLAARGGMGLEGFYTRLGWREIGRWPNKLRLAPDDTRDEVLMILDPL